MLLHPHRCGEYPLRAGQYIPQEADMVCPLEREQLELPVECPAVGLQRGVGKQLHLLVVDLLRPAHTGHAGAVHCAVNDVRVDDVDDGLEIYPPRVAGDGRLIGGGAAKHGA